MSMQEFRRMAARIDQQMGLLAAQGVVDEHASLDIALTQMTERTADLAKHCIAENKKHDT